MYCDSPAVQYLPIATLLMGIPRGALVSVGMP
jgi:hypothetical protein